MNQKVGIETQKAVFGRLLSTAGSVGNFKEYSGSSVRKTQRYNLENSLHKKVDKRIN